MKIVIYIYAHNKIACGCNVSSMRGSRGRDATTREIARVQWTCGLIIVVQLINCGNL